jgi:lysozyme
MGRRRAALKRHDYPAARSARRVAKRYRKIAQRALVRIRKRRARATEPAAASAICRGIDVSVHQGTPSFVAVKAAGHQFAVCKATEGLSYTDPTFDRNWKAIKAAGLVRGAYHFARPQPGRSGRDEAKHFLSVAKFQKGDLRPVLDIETSAGLGTAALDRFVADFITEVKRQLGVTPIIYTGSWWRQHHLSNSHRCPLWLAAYVRDPRPYIPKGWTAWDIWQYSSTARVPGVRGNVDADVAENLKSLTRR